MKEPAIRIEGLSKTYSGGKQALNDVSFDVPVDGRVTALGERPARYWELAVNSEDVPGVDYSASFYVPVYGGRR